MVTKVEKPAAKKKAPAERSTKSNSQASASAAPAKKAKTGPKQQSSLMNFFGKK